MLTCSIWTHGLSSVNWGCLEKAAGGRRHQVSAELSAIRNSAGNPPIPWCGLRGTSPSETGRPGAREHKQYFLVLCAEHAPGTERPESRQGARFDLMRAQRPQSKRRRRIERATGALQEITSPGRDSVINAKTARRLSPRPEIKSSTDYWNQVQNEPGWTFSNALFFLHTPARRNGI